PGRQVRAAHAYAERRGRLGAAWRPVADLTALDVLAGEPGLSRLRRPGAQRRREAAAGDGSRRQDLAHPAQPRAPDRRRERRGRLGRHVLPGGVVRYSGARAGRRRADSRAEGDPRPGGVAPAPGGARVAPPAPPARAHRSLVQELSATTNDAEAATPRRIS